MVFAVGILASREIERKYKENSYLQFILIPLVESLCQPETEKRALFSGCVLFYFTHIIVIGTIQHIVIIAPPFHRSDGRGGVYIRRKGKEEERGGRLRGLACRWRDFPYSVGEETHDESNLARRGREEWVVAGSGCHNGGMGNCWRSLFLENGALCMFPVHLFTLFIGSCLVVNLDAMSQNRTTFALDRSVKDLECVWGS